MNTFQAVTTSKWEMVEANPSEDEEANGSDNTPVYDRSGPHTQLSQNSHGKLWFFLFLRIVLKMLDYCNFGEEIKVLCN